MATAKTGEVYFRTPEGALFLAQSYEDEDGVVTTYQIEVEPAPETDK
jgi:hypothetical protein